jgi:hypothetical protein
MGLREKYFIDIYVGALYLSTPTHDGAAAIAENAPKRMVMHFIYSSISRQQMIDSFNEDFGKQPGVSSHQANIQKLMSVLPEAVVSGDEIVFDYAPATGTTMSHNRVPLVTIPGSEFMKLIFGIFVGANPPTAALKAGLLGG